MQEFEKAILKGKVASLQAELHGAEAIARSTVLIAHVPGGGPAMVTGTDSLNTAIQTLVVVGEEILEILSKLVNSL